MKAYVTSNTDAMVAEVQAFKARMKDDLILGNELVSMATNQVKVIFLSFIVIIGPSSATGKGIWIDSCDAIIFTPLTIALNGPTYRILPFSFSL